MGSAALENRGSIAERPITTLLQTMQAERSTGTLQIRRGSDLAQFFFLFGHLFHALIGTPDGTLQGEDAVFRVLAWGEGEFTFDPKAKLPPEETIKASTHEILEAALARGLSAEAAPGSAPSPPLTRAPRPAEAPLPEAATPPGELYPLPLGTLVYESLKTGFVDFPKLLRSLQADGLTGYLKLTARNASGIVLFYRGNLMEALYDGGAVVSTGRTAFQLVKGNVDRGEGTLDVHSLGDEIVHAIYHLLTAPPYLQGLVARFVKPDELLAHLQEERMTGPLIVRSPDDLGVLMLREGNLLGAYTRQQRTLSDQPDVIFALCQNPRSRIEVRAAQSDDEPPSTSLEDALAAAPARDPYLAPAAPPPVPPPTAPPPRAATVDWSRVVGELASMADRALGNRSKQVKKALASADHARDDLLRAIDQIPQLSIMFVDQARLSSLAMEMRTFVESQP